MAQFTPKMAHIWCVAVSYMMRIINYLDNRIIANLDNNSINFLYLTSITFYNAAYNKNAINNLVSNPKDILLHKTKLDI